VKDGTVKPYEGDMSDYRRDITGDSGDRKERREAEKQSKADRRREGAQRRAALEPLAKEIKATEALIERIRRRIDGIEDQLADPTLYEREPKAATQLAKERSELVAALSGHEDNWLTLSAEYEEGIAE
jgi:ATP-binding cassette subfamily F protein 3